MKRIPIVFIFLFMAFNAFCQNKPTFYALIFADTYDEKIGSGAEISKQKFDFFLKTIANDINYEYDALLLAGRDCSKESLEQCLNDFTCDTNDIVVFCYLGHGGRSPEDTSLFPQMCLHESSSSNYVPLERVKNELAKHGAKLTIVIGDCCNSYGENIKPKPIPQEGPTMLPGATVNLIDQLFKQTSGVVIMCASKPGTYGWTNSVTGMYFNNALMEAIKSANLNSIIPGQPWQSVMNIVMKDLTTNPIVMDGQSYIMEPRYRMESKRARKGLVIKKSPLPSTLQRDLSAIANRNTHPIERTRMVPDILQKYFVGEGVVRTVSEDGVAYGSIFTFQDYLKRVARSESIVNIIVRNMKTDANGKITYIEVNEVFTKLK